MSTFTLKSLKTKQFGSRGNLIELCKTGMLMQKMRRLCLGRSLYLILGIAFSIHCIGWGLWYATPRERSNSQVLYLSFRVCNGLSNQRLSIAYAAVLAESLSAHLILPKVQLNGIEHMQGRRTSVPFAKLFDEDVFISTLRKSLRINVSTSPVNRTVVGKTLDCVNERTLSSCLARLDKHVTLLSFGCLFQSGMWNVGHLNNKLNVFNSALSALQPAERLRKVANDLVGSIKLTTRRERYTFLHLRVEEDWLHHCFIWQGGKYEADCVGNVHDIGRIMHTKGISKTAGVYIAFDEVYANAGKMQAFFEGMKMYGYRVFTRKDIMQQSFRFEREEWAFIDHFVGMQSTEMIGNSISTLSALLIAERRMLGLWSSQYNRGRVPLEEYLPMYKVPWIFSLSGSDYDELVKAAVLSAVAHKKLKPYCMALPTANRSILHWLKKHSVVVIEHYPNWADEILAMRNATATGNRIFSHLYDKDEAVLGTYLRIDLPIIHEFMQYEWIMYADTDTFFRKGFLSENVLPNIVSIHMGYESSDHFPMNAGIILANTTFLRDTYEEFLSFIQSHGIISYPGYGPMDQGAINQFYEKEIRSLEPLSSHFNSKPYKRFDPKAGIVHFHGPKPKDYEHFLQQAECKFGDMCFKGVCNGYCMYFCEWYFYSNFSTSFTTTYKFCCHSTSIIRKVACKLGSKGLMMLTGR